MPGEPDELDVALVKLVLSGAPTQLLWMRPEVIDLQDLPDPSQLREAIEKAEEEAWSYARKRAWIIDLAAGAWLGLRRLSSAWFRPYCT